MPKKKTKDNQKKGDCVTRGHPVPAQELSRYGVDKDPHSEKDIADYVYSQAHDETVQHVERIKQEVVLGDKYEIWDVITDKNRWWVITEPTNLYSQRHFPSLDYTLSFHIGLMMRLRSQPNTADSEDPTPFDEVFRRQEQAKHRNDTAVEAEDYQAVGMQLRECMISLIGALRRRVTIPPEMQLPQDSNFVSWSELLMDQLCGGSSNKELRQHLKNTAKETWQLVNWLTHDRNANHTASTIAINSCDSVVGHFFQILMRERTGDTVECPLCKSRNIRTHFDITIEPDGDYYMTCGVCDWSNHPTGGKLIERASE
ncbi:MAG TPA: hypothetical protein VGQ79_04140 [Nitrospiraceae bacterium]|jgi:hypothetical protein|nr:hypothetical protein [Nitrospiraceae bacterium]